MIVVFASINDKRHHRGSVYTMCVTRIGKPDNLDVFTPTATIVYGHKRYAGDTRFLNYQSVTDREYTRIYAQLLKERSVQVREWIDNITNDVTLCCFCRRGTFCHRYILAKWFKSYREDLEIQIY